MNAQIDVLGQVNILKNASGKKVFMMGNLIDTEGNPAGTYLKSELATNYATLTSPAELHIQHLELVERMSHSDGIQFLASHYAQQNRRPKLSLPQQRAR